MQPKILIVFYFLHLFSKAQGDAMPEENELGNRTETATRSTIQNYRATLKSVLPS
jgi:hypothetical protein